MQVLSFYYRYLAAAQPLTDVVYGAEVRFDSVPKRFFEVVFLKLFFYAGRVNRQSAPTKPFQAGARA